MITRRGPSFTISILVVLGATVIAAILLGACSSPPKPEVIPETPAPVLFVTAGAATASPAAVAVVTPPAAQQPASAATLEAAPLPPSQPTAPPAPTALPPTETNAPLPTLTATTTSPATRSATATLRPKSTAIATRPPTVNASPTVAGVPQGIVWDPRLTERGVVLIPAQVQPGQGYWRLVQGQWFDVSDPPLSGKHHIFVEALDSSGRRQIGVPIRLAVPDLREIFGYIGTEAKDGEPYAAGLPMYKIAPAYRVEPADGAPADAVSDLGLGNIEHPDLPMLTSYGFTWKWTVAGQNAPVATPTPAGTNPGNALTVPAGPLRLAFGQRMWYAFNYAGDSSQIQIQMGVTPPGAASFAIWTPTNVKHWTQGNPENPEGRGTPNSWYNGDLLWSGNFNQPGTYYVSVDQTGPYTGSVNLSISGDGVSPAGLSQ